MSDEFAKAWTFTPETHKLEVVEDHGLNLENEALQASGYMAFSFHQLPMLVFQANTEQLLKDGAPLFIVKYSIHNRNDATVLLFSFVEYLEFLRYIAPVLEMTALRPTNGALMRNLVNGLTAEKKVLEIPANLKIR